VRPCGNLRYDAAVLGVQRDLRRDEIRADAAAVFDDGDRRFVARGFDGKNAGQLDRSSA
jgi:hypothetical protein